MRHKLRQMALNLVMDTPLESLARAVYGRLTGADAPDRQTAEVMRRVLDRRSNCIDVGGYRGEVLKDIVKLAPGGTHYVFEPVPRNHEYLAQKYPELNVLDIALSDTRGEATFCEVASRPARSGLQRVKYPSEKEEVREITVRTDTLDNVIPENLQIDFIKIDVEGAEYQVLKGAGNLIRRCRPVTIFEHGAETASAYDTRPEHLHELLHGQYGMEVTTMQRWLSGAQALTEAEFGEVCRRGEELYFMVHRPGFYGRTA